MVPWGARRVLMYTNSRQDLSRRRPLRVTHSNIVMVAIAGHGKARQQALAGHGSRPWQKGHGSWHGGRQGSWQGSGRAAGSSRALLFSFVLKMRFLNLCSGTGSVSKPFRDAGWEVVGCDWCPRHDPTHVVELTSWECPYPPPVTLTLCGRPPIELNILARVPRQRPRGIWLGRIVWLSVVWI